MIKAEALKILRKALYALTLGEVCRRLEEKWVNIPRQNIDRILKHLVEAGLVMRRLHPYSDIPCYALTRYGEHMVDLIEHIEFYGQIKPEELYASGFEAELIKLAVKLGILEEKRGLIKIITTGCEDLPTALGVKGVFCPRKECNHLIPVEEFEWPTYVTCPTCGEELKHTGKGIYLPRSVVRENLLEFLPSILGGFTPVLTVAGVVLWNCCMHA